MTGCLSSESPIRLAAELALNLWARRIPNATAVKVGLAWPEEGKTEVPATKRLLTPKTRQFLSTTPVSSVKPIRVVPI